MGVLSAALLCACLSLSAAQLSGTTGGTSGGTSLPAGSGPLDAASGNVPSAGSSAPANSNNNNAVSAMFRNPLMSYGLMGGDNLNRAFMMPFLSRLGGSNTANYYYLRGGMDKYAKVMMSDMLGNLMAQSMGLNPMLAAMFAGQITDAPDSYAFSNMLLNRRGLFGQGSASGSSGLSGQQGQGSGLLPTGAASPFHQQPGSLFG